MARETISTVNNVIRDGFNALDPNAWELSLGSNDTVTSSGNVQGASYLKLSKCVVCDDTDTVLTSKFAFSAPTRISLGLSVSQRIAQQRISVELVGINASNQIVATMPLSEPVAITTFAQTTTTATITTSTPHGFIPGERIQIYGVNFSSANYGEVYVATVTSPTVFTVTSTVSATIPSATINGTGGFVQKVDIFQQANNVFGIVWENTSTANAKLASRSGTSTFYGSETSLGSGHLTATQLNTNNFTDSFATSNIIDLRYRSEGVVVRSFPIDSLTGANALIRRSQVIPDITSGYRIRIRVRNNKELTRPVAKIATISKAGSSTATITTDIPHGLVAQDIIMLYGVRDQTNFANLTAGTQVASIVSPTQFTIAFGASATATSHGGSVIRVQGSALTSPISQSIQSIQVSGSQIIVTGSGTWAGLTAGETVQLHGVADNTTGAIYPLFEGIALKVLGFSTTTLTLENSTGIADQTITVGGTVFKRTDLRLHFLRLLDYDRVTAEIDGGVGNATDNQESIPVGVNGTVTAGGQTAHDGAVSTSTNPIRIGVRAQNVTPTNVSATNDATEVLGTMTGAIVNKPYSVPEVDFQFASAVITTTADTVIKAAGAAGVRNYLTALQYHNTNATATEIQVKDGSTVIFRGYAPANMAYPATIEFITPLKGTAATALNFACVTTAANVYMNAQGYQAP